MPQNSVRGALLGLAVGDALGVPHEFRPRYELERKPVTGMDGYGTWNQAPGTWSDNTSLSLCLAESLSVEYNLYDIADRMIAWLDKAYWSARGEVFDVGRSTAAAIGRLRNGVVHPADAGLRRERDNGNGALIRVLPAVFCLKDRSADERAWIVAELSSLTHGHRRSQLACIVYVEVARYVLSGATLGEAYGQVSVDLSARFACEDEAHRFSRILSGYLSSLKPSAVSSSGYVVDTLEAALWCLLTTASYPEAVLRAVNLGGETDTLASIVGGLAGLAYGVDAIPADWLSVLTRRQDIEDLADRLATRYGIA